MSNRALTWAFLQELPSTDKFVLVSLAEYADERATCTLSRNHIAVRTGTSVATVQRAVTRLSTAGYITVTRRHQADGGLAPNRYQINLDTPTHNTKERDQ